MGGFNFTSPSAVAISKNFSGGLNTTAGSLSLDDSESEDLQNIEFDKFGSIMKRAGYTALNTSAISTSPDIDGLHWYEYVSSGSFVRKAIAVAGAKIFKMDDLDGTWDDISAALTITAGNHWDFENFLNEMYGTNGQDLPLKWTGTGNAALMTVPTNLTKAKFVKQFNNYLFLGNVTVNSVVYKSRIYWSAIKDTSTWDSADFIDIAKDDGQEITGLKVLSDRLVVYKNRAIYTVFFTGDADIPFVLPGGGKTNSSVGCVAPYSIQEVENGHVFLSYDGIYYFDGNSSFKLSDRINDTILGFNTTRFSQAVSLVYKSNTQYMLSFPASGGTENSIIIVWDFAINSFSYWTGFAPCAMATFFVDGVSEKPYFGDYSGFVYRMDNGLDDYPLNVQTAIDAYYYTNWRSYDDLINKKGVARVVIYYQTSNAVLSFSYSYDLETADQYTNSFSLSAGTSVYGSALYGEGTYAASGGRAKRRDLTGRGRTVRFKFANSTLSETFRIDALGQEVFAETNA